MFTRLIHCFPIFPQPSVLSEWSGLRGLAVHGLLPRGEEEEIPELVADGLEDAQRRQEGPELHVALADAVATPHDPDELDALRQPLGEVLRVDARSPRLRGGPVVLLDLRAERKEAPILRCFCLGFRAFW